MTLRRLLVLATLLTACAVNPTFVPPTAMPTRTATVSVPTRTATAPPTATVLGQAGTAVASPTLPATVAATLGPTPIPSATPDGRLGPDVFPAGVNPLTGQVAADPSLLAHRPLAVKIVNEPACARPQYGLEHAAVVFEHYVEAWGTRFTAIYYGEAAATIGAVRSARLIDLELPAIFDAIFVFSGSSGGVKARLQQSDFAGRVIASEWQATCPPLCRVPIDTVPCADLEHTLFTTLPSLWQQAAESGLDQPPQLHGWAFTEQPPPGGQSAPAVHIGFVNSPVDWGYEPDNTAPGQQRYFRWQDGVRHVDAETHRRLSADNVVVLLANQVYSDIRESSNFYSLEIQFWGQGRALVFRDGLAYEAQWLRPERAGLFQIVDASGAPLPLHPGRTWFEFVPLDAAVTPGATRWTITAPELPPQTPPR